MSEHSMDGSDHGEVCYRVVGHYGGSWDKTVWMSSLEEADEAYRQIKRGNWSQLSIERTDGKLKSSPESDEWYQQSGSDRP